MKLGARALTPTSLLKKGIGVGARALNFEFGKKLVGEEIKQAPELHKFGTSKIKNKGLRKALELDIANYAVQEAQKRLKTYLVDKKMSKRISNFQTEKALKDISDPDINDNFVGAFHANHMSRFIDYKRMISERKGKYPFTIANTDGSDKNGTHWWSILDIEPRRDLFF